MSASSIQRFVKIALFLQAPLLWADAIYLHDGSQIVGEIIESVPSVSYTIKKEDETVQVFGMENVWKVRFEEKGVYKDTLYLKDGSKIVGEIIESLPKETYRIKTRDGSTLAFKMEGVERVEFGKREPAKPKVVTPSPSPPPKPVSRLKGSVNFLAGSKVLDEKDWAPAHEQREIGFDLNIEPKGLPVSIVVEYLRATGKGTSYDYGVLWQFESKTSELNIGVCKVWEKGSLRPFLGGGLSYITGELTGSSALGTASGSDSTFGAFFNAGICLVMGKLNLGVKIRGSSGEIELFGVKGDAGGSHCLLSAGINL